MHDYSDLGRMTATAIIDGHLDADGLAEVVRAVLALDRPRALALVSGQTRPHPTKEDIHAHT